MLGVMAVCALAAEPAGWQGAIVTAKVAEDSRARVWTDLHGRVGPGETFVGIVRPGVGWDLGRGVAAWGGYAWIPTSRAGDLSQEHRIWQQVTWNARRDRVGGGLRGRLEQRFAPGTSGVGLRVRAFGRAQADVAGPVSAVVWNESFLVVNRSGFLPPGFDQNRVFLGPAVSSGAIRAEVGVLQQHLLRAGSVTAVTALATNVFIAL